MNKKLDHQKHSSSTIVDILDILKKNGLRLTSQRIELIKVLRQSKISLSTKDLFKKLKNQKIKIDEASVYRIIEAFKDLDIVHANSNGKIKLCSHLTCTQKFHLSLECDFCGKVEEPHLEPSKEYDIAKILNINLNSIRHLHINYVCENCR